MKNYYQILNVKPNATDVEIKRNYRVLAKKYHPDVNPGNEAAANRFTDINEAHDVLSDPKRRAEYDAKLKEASAPKPRPEDIIARQRAAAQAAARNAAMRENMARAHHQGGTLDPSVMVQRAAAQQTSQVNAQAVAQQVQNMQAQMATIKNNAYKAGYDKGFAAARAVADKEESKLTATMRQLRMEIADLKTELTSIEADRSDLEQELFKRDCELTQEKRRADDLEYKLSVANAHKAEKPRKHTTAEYDELAIRLEDAHSKLKLLEKEKTQSELRNQAQIQLQHDKRQHLQDELDKQTSLVLELKKEIESLRAENEQWQQYAKSEDFISEAERRLQEWDKKQKADKKLAKTTLYGPLGVLIWATSEEIDAAYAKLVKYYSSKHDENSEQKLGNIQESYAVLSDPEKRAAYNESIGIDDERIKKERAAIEENEQMEEEYRNQLESKEFWKNFDELSFKAQSGDADSQNELGEMYYFGDEIEQDLDQAVYWFKEAAKQKHATAMYNLGICFVNGEGVENNKTTGLGFIRQAAKLGSDAAKEYIDSAKVQQPD